MMRRSHQSLSDVAQTLHEIIKESPGIHFRSLGREAGLSSVGQLRHHLDTLRRQGAIVELEDGRFKRFFAAGAHEPRLRDGLSRFARRVPRRIAKLLLSRPMNRTEIRRSLNCADSTLGYHLNRMVEQGDLKRSRGRNCCIYSLTDPDFVRELLQHHPGPTRHATASGTGDRLHERARVAHHEQVPEPVLARDHGLGGDGGPSPPPPADAPRPRDPEPDPSGERDPGPAHQRPVAARTRRSPPEGAQGPAKAGSKGANRPESGEDRASRNRDDASEVPRWLLSG